MASREWYYLDGDKWIGPFTDKGLKTLADDGIVLPKANLSLNGKVVLAEKVAGLFSSKPTGFPVAADRPIPEPAEAPYADLGVRNKADTKYILLLTSVVIFGVISLVNMALWLSSDSSGSASQPLADNGDSDKVKADIDDVKKRVDELNDIINKLTLELDAVGATVRLASEPQNGCNCRFDDVIHSLLNQHIIAPHFIDNQEDMERVSVLAGRLRERYATLVQDQLNSLEVAFPSSWSISPVKKGGGFIVFHVIVVEGEKPRSVLAAYGKDNEGTYIVTNCMGDEIAGIGEIKLTKHDMDYINAK